MYEAPIEMSVGYSNFKQVDVLRELFFDALEMLPVNYLNCLHRFFIIIIGI